MDPENASESATNEQNEAETEPEQESSAEPIAEDVGVETLVAEASEALPEGVSFTATGIDSATEDNQSKTRLSTSTLYWDALARPKATNMKGTIERFGKMLPEKSVENLKRMLAEQSVVKQKSYSQHSLKCIHEPVPKPPIYQKKMFVPEKTAQYMEKFNKNLKRVFLDRLMERIFENLPGTVLEADITNLSDLDPASQRLVNVIFATITGYTRKPMSVHDHELYIHLAVGLAKFIGSVIQDVQRGCLYLPAHDEERILATELLGVSKAISIVHKCQMEVENEHACTNT
ncbi:uncharacterized protein LOC129758172 [Uranotaenia lowii]|uniref:uncharacterized protein LOC129758172 n=1 Tax=Uranotaenia lowii TaxID=190385 RepID=UPI0024790549|nr:uncharacterized protein LOC129758172 [Uranotaenia lowii]